MTTWKEGNTPGGTYTPTMQWTRISCIDLCWKHSGMLLLQIHSSVLDYAAVLKYEDDDVRNSGDSDTHDWKMTGSWRLILDAGGKLWQLLCNAFLGEWREHSVYTDKCEGLQRDAHRHNAEDISHNCKNPTWFWELQSYHKSFNKHWLYK